MTDDEHLCLSPEAKKIYDKINNFCMFECPIHISSAKHFLKNIMSLQEVKDRQLLIAFLKLMIDSEDIPQLDAEIRKKEDQSKKQE